MTHQKWLLQELDHWRRDGIIDGAVQEAIQKRYAADPSAVSWRQITRRIMATDYLVLAFTI